MPEPGGDLDLAISEPIDAPAGLKRPVKRAKETVQDEKRLRRLLREAAQKAMRSRDRLGAAFADLATIVRLLWAWVTRRYRSVPWRVLILATASVLYFVNPFDLIPDFLGVGLLDDLGILAFAVGQMRSDLDRFRAWERGEGMPDDAVDLPPDLL